MSVRYAPTILDHDVSYAISFGRGVVDLSNLAPPMRDIVVDIRTLFGVTEVRTPSTIAYDVSGRSIAGETRLPDAERTLGSVAYEPNKTLPQPAYEPTTRQPRLHIRVSNVFGSCRIVAAS